MTTSDLIGRVAARFLRGELSGDRGGERTTARYLIHRLAREQIAAIARHVLEDAALAGQVEVKLPAHLMQGFTLPATVLTTYPATYYRNAVCEKPALLVVNTGDQEEQSLKEFTPLGAGVFEEHPELWVRVAADGLALTADEERWWEKALAGLQDQRMCSLDQLAAYVLRTRAAVEADGFPILKALGVALPALRLPRDGVFSQRVKDKDRGHKSAWRNQFNWVKQNRACYLEKRNTSHILLSEEDLVTAFERVKDSIPSTIHPAVEAFIAAPSGWNPQAAAIAECEWEQVKPLFDGMKREKYNLGQATLTFFDDRGDDLLSVEDREYLGRLAQRSATDPGDEDIAFYESHRQQLRDDRKLKSAWDRFVFGKPRETEDFLAGLASCLETLFAQAPSGTKRKLRIRCDRTVKKDLKELNADAGLFFAKRYAGLRKLLGDRVTWDVGPLFSFQDLVADWDKAKKPRTTSVSRSALQLKFTVELEVSQTGSSQTTSTQLIWRFNPNTVASQFADDWGRLEKHPLVFCRATRESTGSKGRFQTVDLSNIKTFVAVYDRDRGSFVAVYKPADDLATTWRKNLQAARDQRLLDAPTAVSLRARFEAFATAYTAAIQGFAAEGLASPTLLAQATAYCDLLDALCRKAKGDRNRDLLLRPLLQVGTVLIEGGPTAAVVAPWHPLRLAAVHRKASAVAELVRYLLTTAEVYFGDPRLFFKDLRQELAHPFYPELAIGWRENKPELLVLTDAVQDYSLHESPVLDQEETDDTNENPTEGSNCVHDLVERYLTLQPHEEANMSVVLYNCDSARLPQAVVDKLGTLYEGDDDVRCQVLLRHVDGIRLRELYKAIIGLSDADADSFNASEATQDFMARLRICIIADQAPPPDPKDGRPYDIVFCQDVIARHATVAWYPVSAEPVPLATLVPAHWSRRRPAAKDDMKSVVYLCCPVQSAEGWAYLTALTTFLKGDWDEAAATRLLPARELDFRDPKTARIFEETHDLGNWVVNYDELLDRRQLLNQSVRVIRYKQSATQGRNLIISSKADHALLRSMIRSRLEAFNLELGPDAYQTLCQRFIDDANDISGDIVLRAAQRGRNASELMGIVLSRYLVRRELGTGRYYGWYFLDDYAEWLGQREEQIADVLVLSPEPQPGGKFRLVLVVTEAKYIDAASLAAKRKESQKQLRDTVDRINEAVFGSPERLDRSLWLARLSDLILDGVQFSAASGIDLAQCRRAIREGDCEIYLRGYSHVFVSGPPDASDVAAFCPVTGMADGYQEVFGRAEVRDLVLRYFRDEDPMPVRRKVAGDNLWASQTYRRPTDPTVTIVSMTPTDTGGDPGTPLPPPSPPEPPTPPPGGSPSPPGPVPTLASLAPEPGAAGWAYAAIPGLITGAATAADSDADREWLKQTESKTKTALQQFQLQAKLASSVLTPNCAILKFVGSANLTVEQVAKRQSEFLTTHGLKIVAVRPEPGIVALSVERPNRRVIRTPELWQRWNPVKTDGPREVLIGQREDDGKLLFLSPGKHAPHTLIAGSTNSGKSVLMQNIILGIAALNTPRQARIVLIDPKQGVDYFAFESLPHLQGGLIDQQDQASQQLEALAVEMDQRYQKFRAAKVPNLTAFNQKVAEAERLPLLWLIHDEFAEWMLIDEYKEQVSAVVGRLGVKARAAGIYLIFAAQRPDANVMPMQLRANLGNRLILKVDSEGTSEIALGEPGAEKLLGYGHMIAKLEGSPGLTYGQVPLADGEFIDQVVAAARAAEGAASV